MGPDGDPAPTTTSRSTSHADPARSAPAPGIDAVVAGLRRGDLAFVVTAVACLEPLLGAGAGAGEAGRPGARLTHDVAFALADLCADPGTAALPARRLVALAVARAGSAPPGGATGGG